MTNKQIQPVRSRDYQITQRARPRGLWGQVWMVLLQPGYFFRTLPLLEDTRTWLWAAILILALTGITAVRQDSMLSGSTGAPSSSLGNIDPGGGLSRPGGFSSSPIEGGGGGGGEIPFDGGMPPTLPGGADSSADVATTWTTALLAGAAILLGWVVLTIILSEVALFNGRAPSLGQNFQVVVWASIPFALMAGLQLIFYAAGGKAGGAGVSGILAEWSGYQALPEFWQAILLSLTSRLTVFWLWSLVLIYIGARNALHGKRWSSALVVVVWAILLVVVPAITGGVQEPPPSGSSDTITPGGLPDELLIVPGEENLTGELQGRFAERNQGGAGEVIPQDAGDSQPSDMPAIDPTDIPEDSGGDSPPLGPIPGG